MGEEKGGITTFLNVIDTYLRPTMNSSYFCGFSISGMYLAMYAGCICAFIRIILVCLRFCMYSTFHTIQSHNVHNKYVWHCKIALFKRQYRDYMHSSVNPPKYLYELAIYNVLRAAGYRSAFARILVFTVVFAFVVVSILTIFPTLYPPLFFCYYQNIYLPFDAQNYQIKHYEKYCTPVTVALQVVFAMASLLAFLVVSYKFFSYSPE